LLRALDALLEALLAALEAALAPLHPLLGATSRGEAEADLLERLVHPLKRLRPVPGVLGTGRLQVLARGLERLLGSLHVRVLLGADGSMHPPVSNDIFYIVPEKCTECVGFHDHEACAAVCPVDCCVPDPNIPETHEVLLARARTLHPELTIADDAPSRFKKEGAAAPAAGALPGAAGPPGPPPAPQPAAPASAAPPAPVAPPPEA